MTGIQAALNGGRTKDEHPAVPLTAEELAAEALACARAGVFAIHLHARDAEGRETIDPDVVNHVARVVKAASGLPVGVSSAPWIEPDDARRAELMDAWTEPDFGSALWGDPGAAALTERLLAKGMVVEAAVLEVGDVANLAASGLAPRLSRVIVEPVVDDAQLALRMCAEMHAALDEHGITLPRLQHGMNSATWPVARDAAARGIETRIGFEDVLTGPGGEPVAGNADLVHAIKGWSA